MKSGFRVASAAARDALLACAQDNVKNAERFKQDLMNIARTTLSSKILAQEKDYFAKLCVDAVLRLKVISTLNYTNS
jgi:T-complex protein 1 subunit beta